MSIREELKAFVDGELTPSREAEVRQLIEQDPTLQAEVVELRQISRAIREAAPQPESVGLESTLLALASKRSGSRAWYRTSRLALGFGLAATILIAIAVIPNLSRMGSASDAAGSSTEHLAFKSASVVTADAAKESSTLSSPMAAERATNNSESSKVKAGGAGGGLQSDTKAGSPARRPPQSQAESSYGFGSVPSEAPADVLLRPAFIEVQVDDLSTAQADIRRVADEVKGRVEAATTKGSAVEGTAELVLRVPESKLATAWKRLRGVGTVVTEAAPSKVAASGLTEAQARLKVLRQQENSYRQLLKRSDKVSDALAVEKDLAGVRQQIATVEARTKKLKAEAAMPQIRITLVQKSRDLQQLPEESSWVGKTWAGAFASLRSVGRGAAALGVYALVFVPLWVPAVGVAWWASRRKVFGQ
jgi:hypothetical protein